MSLFLMEKRMIFWSIAGKISTCRAGLEKRKR
jgi:hypothetical protein